MDANDASGAKEGPEGLPRVTYHDPCHLSKSMGVSEEPRRILESLSGWEYVEMPEADRCCGNGGTFNLSHYDISLKIGERKRDNIVSVSPSAVATTCPACMLQLMDQLGRKGDLVEVRHVAELYAEDLGLDYKALARGEAPGIHDEPDTHAEPDDTHAGPDSKTPGGDGQKGALGAGA